MQPTRRPAARCSRPLCSSQSTGGTPNHPPTRGNRKRPRGVSPDHHPKAMIVSGPSGPNSVQARHPKPSPFPPPKRRTRKELHPSHHVKCSTHELPARNGRPRSGFWTPRSSMNNGCQMLLRKEVIQPHLPVRLPCYDLVLITDPTFDGSLQKG